jgi:hypothetical protein
MLIPCTQSSPSPLARKLGRIAAHVVFERRVEESWTKLVEPQHTGGIGHVAAVGAKCRIEIRRSLQRAHAKPHPCGVYVSVSVLGLCQPQRGKMRECGCAACLASCICLQPGPAFLDKCHGTNDANTASAHALWVCFLFRAGEYGMTRCSPHRGEQKIWNPRIGFRVKRLCYFTECYSTGEIQKVLDQRPHQPGRHCGQRRSHRHRRITVNILRANI